VPLFGAAESAEKYLVKTARLGLASSRAVLALARFNPKGFDMKQISLSLLAATALAICSLSISAPIFSSNAYASKMNGKGTGCSDTACRGINSPSAGKKAAPKKSN
jgi:hypothetical protein